MQNPSKEPMKDKTKPKTDGVTMAYQIEKDVPIPPPRVTGKLKGALEALEVGESVFFHDKTYRGFGGHFQKLRPKKFTIRKMEGTDPEGNTVIGMRVWRTE